MSSATFAPRQREPSFKPKPQIETVKAPFTGTSTYHLDFPPNFDPGMYSSPQPSFKPKRSASAAGNAAFTGNTVYNDTFIPHMGASPTTSCRPNPNASQIKRPPTAFVGTTSYSSDFHDFDLTVVARPPSCAPKAQMQQQQHLFVGSSSYAADFVGAQGERSASYKPQATSAASGGERMKFEGRSQAQDSFVYMRPEPSRNFKPQPSQQNEAKDTRSFATESSEK